MTPSPLIDLGYADPAPPPDLADRARRQGRAASRRRRAAGTAAVLALAAAGVTVQLPDPVAVGPAADPTALPVNRGTDPSLTFPGTTTGDVGMEPGSDPVVWQTGDDGTRSVLWFTRNGWLCSGEATPGVSPPRPHSCDPLTDAPAEGLWKTVVLSNAELPPDSREPVDSVVAGVVRGPVTRVSVELPLSGPVDAALVPAPDGIGTLYWLTTRDFTMAGTVAGSSDPTTFTVTAYRGETPAFRCDDAECLSR